MPSGTQQQIYNIMEDTEVENVIEVTMGDLSKDQRKLVQESVESYQKLWLESFTKTRNRAVLKNQLPNPSVMDLPLDERAMAPGGQLFQETVNEAMHHALINQPGVLINTLTNLINQVVDGSVRQESKGTCLLYSRSIGFQQ